MLLAFSKQSLAVFYFLWTGEVPWESGPWENMDESAPQRKGSEELPSDGTDALKLAPFPKKSIRFS